MNGRWTRFPPIWGHLEIPTSSRSAALAGLALYAPCRRWTVIAHRITWRLTSVLGPVALPGRRIAWVPPMEDGVWPGLVRQWESWLGRLETFAVYRRRPAGRAGFNLLALSDGKPRAFLKLQAGDGARLRNEFQALERVHAFKPKSFQAPGCLALGEYGGWHYLGLTPLPPLPHGPPRRPRLEPVLGEIEAALRSLPRDPAVPPHWRPMHGDFTPWNLRRLDDGPLILFDWEDAGWGPPGADETLFRATEAALGRSTDSRWACGEALEYWRQRRRATPPAPQRSRGSTVTTRPKARSGAPLRHVHYYPLARHDSGVAIALWAWARALAARGEKIVVLHAGDWSPTPPPPSFAEFGGEKIADMEVPHRARLHRLTVHPVDLGRYLRQGDLLVLHEGWVLSNVVAAHTARRCGIPYIVVPHGVYDPQWMRYLHSPRSLRARLERRLLEGALAVHLFHESEIPEVRAIAPGARFIVVPTGYDIPRARWTGGGGYLSWIGRIDVTHKGLDLVVAAIASLPVADRPRFLVHGYDYKGGLARLRRLVADRNMEDWVRIEGTVAGEAKRAFLQRAEGYIHASRWECHSTALLENLALGVPCLVSDAIHIAAPLARAGAALLTSPTVESLSERLVELARRRPELAQCGRSFVRERFAWDRIVSEYLDALHEYGLR